MRNVLVPSLSSALQLLNTARECIASNETLSAVMLWHSGALSYRIQRDSRVTQRTGKS